MFPTARGTLPFPLKFGYQEVGEVVAVGEETGLSVGDRVMCLHPHQDVFTLDAELTQKIPPDLSSERAAFGALTWVALNSVLTTPPLVGDCVAVSGLGIVGCLTAHLARKTAGRVILVDPSESRRASASWIGADAVVHPDQAADAIDGFSDGRGVDLFFEASGAPAALQTAIDNTAVEGTISVSAWYGTRPVMLSLSPEFHLLRHKVISTGPMLPPSIEPRWDIARSYEVAWDLLTNVSVEDFLITHRVPFKQATKAYELLDDHGTDTLAVLLEHCDDRPAIHDRT